MAESSTDLLHDYCSELFDTLPRADQRRSGEAYVRGLLGADGRKSIRRIATQRVDGYSDQSLQQFVNQSPWNPNPVRQRLAVLAAERLAAADLGPVGWVLEESVFPKHGRHSAGVERQFVPSCGRVRNCQLGVSVLLATARASVPVHWLLSIPLSWDQDPARRERARIPADQRHRPYWRYQVEALDDLSGDWGIPPAPAVLDARACTGVADLLAELDARGVDYLVELSGNAAAQWRPAPPGQAEGHPGGHTAGGGSLGPARQGTLAELARSAPPQDRRLVAWEEPHWTPASIAARNERGADPAATAKPRGRTLRAQFGLVATHALASPARRPRPVLVEYPLGKAEPRAFWVTNIPDRGIPELVALAKLRLRTRLDLEMLTSRYGLCDYEGRSFLGWHHHVTLASMAYAFDILRSLEGELA